MTPTIPSKNTIAIVHQLHPLPLGLIPAPIFYYQFEHIFILDRTLFAQALATIPHLSSNKLFGMVYEHFSGCFILKDPSSGFSKFIPTKGVLVRKVISLDFE
jgi:hypothetical protein